MRFLLPLILAIIPSVTSAQTAPEASRDARFLTLDYSAGGIFHVPTSPDTLQTILFGQDEVIRSIFLSDPGAYMVGVSGKGDSVSLRPNGPTSLALMTVRSDARSYEIELVAGSASNVPAVVRFAYGILPPAPQVAAPAAQAEGFSYRMSGSAALRPSSIKDDGLKTYLAWDRDQSIPAVFAVGPSGKEEMVDAYMRGGLFTIDHVHKQLVFRIDRQKATARRVRNKEGQRDD
jgi:type IV secretion system protein VirB9